MESKETIRIRRAVINEAISYIFDHIDEEITVDDVADHCCYSKYHLMRMFKEDTDEALYQFIKRVRLERSAWRLKVERERSITDIGIGCGYSASNFATAFKKQLNMTPAGFRKVSEQLVKDCAFSRGISLRDIEEYEDLISIEQLEPFTVIYERKKGNYSELPGEWCRFIDKYRDFADENTLYIECTIDDPSITDVNKCMYELCQTVPADYKAIIEDENVLTHGFEGGKYAVYHFRGYPQFLFMVYQEVFCRWLSRTGNQMDDRPVLDIYRYVGEEGYMEIDICFPLR